tara:strand:+ start:25 stop:372 length:348 start_codon:yes stop_codon:yes gene_type:complete
MAFKMKGYSAYDKMDSAYDKHGMYKKMDSAYDKHGAYKQKEEIKIPTKKETLNAAVTDANIAKFSKDSGYSVSTINSIIKELSDVGGGGMEDDFDMQDVINAVRNRFETNSDEVD